MARSLIAQLRARHGRHISIAERREFLRATLAASSGLLLSSCSIAGNRLGRDSTRRVVVIGAGFAGLACAFELKSAGYDVTVLEARNRIGGRVLSFNAANGTEYIKGRNVEGGAELIGSNHPTWVSYHDRFHLEFLPVTEDEGDAVSAVVIDGQLLDFTAAGKLWADLEGGLNQMNELAAKVPPDAPWQAPDAEQLDHTSTAAWVQSLDTSDLAKRALIVNQESDNGQAADRQSLLGQLAAVSGGGLDKYWSETEVYRCKGGNDQLAAKLAHEIGSERILLNAPVRSIRRDATSVTVITSDGRTFTGDDVVLTAPPTTWHKIEITPALPAALQPQMGLNTKYLAHVKDRIWQTSSPVRSQYALSDGLINMTWDATDAQGPTDASNGGACLTAFAGGPAVARALAMVNDDRDRAFADLYEQFFPGFKAALVATRYMDWPNDEWVKASYSFPAPGQVTTVGPLMAAPHMDGKLHLAGEHTCYKFVGYMEGGLNSGATVARRIAARDGVIHAK